MKWTKLAKIQFIELECILNGGDFRSPSTSIYSECVVSLTLLWRRIDCNVAMLGHHQGGVIKGEATHAGDD